MYLSYYYGSSLGMVVSAYLFVDETSVSNFIALFCILAFVLISGLGKATQHSWYGVWRILFFLGVIRGLALWVYQAHSIQLLTDDFECTLEWIGLFKAWEIGESAFMH